jgi:hypothetical protein
VNFVPIPTTHEHLLRWRDHWLPFLPDVCKRTTEPVESLLDAVASGRVQIALVWDGEKAHALVGMQYRQLGDELVGEIVWLSGKDRAQWVGLLPDMERYLKEHVGCTIIRPICRPGWAPLLKRAGYKMTHLVMERRL